MLKLKFIRNIVTFGVSVIDNGCSHKRIKPVGVV